MLQRAQGASFSIFFILRVSITLFLLVAVKCKIHVGLGLVASPYHPRLPCLKENIKNNTIKTYQGANGDVK